MEEWKTVEIDNVIYDDYEVSTKGRVRNINYRNTGTVRVLKPQLDMKDYYFISIWKDEEKRTFRVHRLVATMFIPNPYNLPQVDHINRNRHDNSVENLRWVSRQQNMNNAGKRIRCVETGEIFDTMAQASRKMNIDLSNLSKHLRGISHKTIKGYTFEYVD